MLDAMVLTDEQVGKYSHLLSYHGDIDLTDYTQEYYLEMCTARRKETCYFFEARGDGFTAKIDLSKENLVFFSVPWEEGWSATVDGQPVEIERVNVAFMAVDVPAGDHVIEFHYMTPGLKPGAVVTLASVLIFAAYLVVMTRRDKKRKAASRSLMPERGELGRDFLDPQTWQPKDGEDDSLEKEPEEAEEPEGPSKEDETPQEKPKE